MVFFIKTLVSALVIAFCSWLAGKKPELAGFIVALPLTSLLVLLLNRLEVKDPATSVQFAKSIFIAVPISLTFFIPFLFAEKWQFGFWTCYLSGLALLILGYFCHRWVMGLM